jgi:hypothetical protein
MGDLRPSSTPLDTPRRTPMVTSAGGNEDFEGEEDFGSAGVVEGDEDFEHGEDLVGREDLVEGEG